MHCRPKLSLSCSWRSFWPEPVNNHVGCEPLPMGLEKEEKLACSLASPGVLIATRRCSIYQNVRLTEQVGVNLWQRAASWCCCRDSAHELASRVRRNRQDCARCD